MNKVAAALSATLARQPDDWGDLLGYLTDDEFAELKSAVALSTRLSAAAGERRAAGQAPYGGPRG